MLGPTQCLEAALSGYYSCLINAMGARLARGSAWQQQTYARQTLRNALCMAMNMVEKAVHHPKEVPWSPSSCTEQCCEHFFGNAKRGVGHNVPSLKAFLLSIHRLHYSQRKQGFPELKQTFWDSSTLTEMDVLAIAQRARVAVCTLFAAVNVGDSPEMVSKRLETWWEDEGRRLILGRHTDPQPHGEIQEDGVDSGSDDESETNVQKLQEDETLRLQYGVQMLEREASLSMQIRNMDDDALQSVLQDSLQDADEDAARTSPVKSPTKTAHETTVEITTLANAEARPNRKPIQ